MRPKRRTKHTDLFLVRIWVRDLDDGSQGDQGTLDLHGRVQRTLDGEAHEFGDWPELLNWLIAMLEAGLGEETARALLPGTDPRHPRVYRRKRRQVVTTDYGLRITERGEDR